MLLPWWHDLPTCPSQFRGVTHLGTTRCRDRPPDHPGSGVARPSPRPGCADVGDLAEIRRQHGLADLLAVAAVLGPQPPREPGGQVRDLLGAARAAAFR